MKKNAVVLVALMLISTLTFAQHRRSFHHRDSTSQTETMKKVLSLNDAQYASVRQIDQKYTEQRSALRKDSTRTRETKHEAIRTLHSQRNAEIQKVLSKEQNTKWEAYQKDVAAKRKEQHEAMAEKHDTKIKTDLALTDDQFTRYQTVTKQFRDKLATLKEDNKQDKSEVKKAKADYESGVKSILNAEQFKKWQALQPKQHHGKHGK
jgi:hypothetical protein